jgi:hypothetical protein
LQQPFASRRLTFASSGNNGSVERCRRGHSAATSRSNIRRGLTDKTVLSRRPVSGAHVRKGHWIGPLHSRANRIAGFLQAVAEDALFRGVRSRSIIWPYGDSAMRPRFSSSTAS